LKRARVLTFHLIFLISGAAAPARGQTAPSADERWPAPSTVDIVMVGAEAVVAPVRELTADLLTRNGVAVFWRRADRLRAEDVIDAPGAGRAAPVAVWVDLSSAVEGRIYFRAAAGRRFVIRRVPLPGGVGPLAAEEIAQIIQSVLRALAADTTWALSLPEARAALHVPEQPPPPPTVPAPVRSTAVEIGSGLVGQSYAAALPVTGSVEVSVAAVSRRAAASPPAFPGNFGGRLSLGYGWPTHFASGAVGADLWTTRVRLALVWEPWQSESGRTSIRIGLGGGADRVDYSPTVELAGAMTAPAATFTTGVASADAALHVALAPRFALLAAVLVDVGLQRVHYDAYDTAGNLTEALVPHRARPGVTIGLEARL
jgi:hypothetical protein